MKMKSSKKQQRNQDDLQMVWSGVLTEKHEVVADNTPYVPYLKKH